MTPRFPRVRLYQDFDGERYLRIRESVSICFYFRHSHQELIPAILRSLDLYRQTIGSQVLAWHPDPEKDWQEFHEEDWEHIRSQLLHPRGAHLLLRERPDAVTGYEFMYHGMNLEDLPVSVAQESVSLVAFWLPTEYLEAHGPARVRELALALASGLPFTSGHAGLSFHFTEGVLGTTAPLRDLCLRYPGFDMPMLESLQLDLGTRIKGTHWLTFLGPPVLESLGGASGLRSRLRSPGTTVQELDPARAVVTLGEWPEAGDREKGLDLPAYRELAKLLEPWRYSVRGSSWSGFTEEDVRSWERRFLE